MGYFRINVKKNNEGFSLVELIVAISVGVIISGAVASIIMISTRMYSKETTNLAEQYEIQTTLNRTVDSAENAQWIALGSAIDGKATEYVAFGKLTGAEGALCFEGDIFTCDYDPTSPDKFNVYMNRYSGSDLAIGGESSAATVIEGAAGAIKSDQYLLGEGATSYVISLLEEDTRFTDDTTATMSDKTTAANGYFVNPIMISVSMDFEKQAMTGIEKKHVEDKVAFRNRLKRPVYIKSRGGYYSPMK